MKRVFVHIGYPKCASTYLQKRVFPQLGNFSNLAFAPLDDKFVFLRRDVSAEEIRQTVQRHITNPVEDDHLIISCEDYVELLFQEFNDVFFRFTGLDPQRYQLANEQVCRNIQSAYPDAQILIVRRTLLDWVKSRYKMLYRGAKTNHTIDRFFEQPLEDFEATAARYRTAFGESQVHMLTFEKLVKEGNAQFVADVLAIIAPGRELAVAEGRDNAAPDLLRTVEHERLKKKIRFALQARGLGLLYPVCRIGTALWAATIVRARHGNTLYDVTIPEPIQSAWRDH